MCTSDSRRNASPASRVSACVLAALLAGCLAAACDGKISTNATGGKSGGGGIGGSNVKPGDVTVPPTPISQDTAYIAVRKVKNLLTGMPPTDEDVALVTTSGAAGLQMLVSTWQTSDPYKSMFAEKMVGFFRNTFQQTGFTPTEDFKIQLLQNGGFDFGPGGARLAGDDAFPRLVQNLQDSFAKTAWQLVQEGRPFTETLTTNRFVMTTALKSLYVQIEMPADAPFNNGSSIPAWHIDYSGNPIPIEQAISTLVFSDEAPATGNGTGFFTNCRGGATVAQADFKGTSLIFQRLLGFTPRFPFSGSPTCGEQASKPYFTTSDLSDWTWVTINYVPTPGDRTNPPIKPYDLPALRTATTLSLSLPRVGFYTTPAFLALWNTNDSNQHRVTANQALLAALGQSFTSDSVIVPLSQDGLDSAHAVAGTECVGCHKSLDPMRQFWGNQLDFNDRNDFPAGNRFTGAAANPRPATTGGAFAFGDVNDKGADLTAYGDLLARVTDGGGLSRFGIAIAQDLCFWANSAPCSESDAEFRRVVGAFQNSTPMPYNFAVLIKEFFASPLVTGAIATGTYAAASVPVSISRRDHLCAALSNRLGKPDLCAQAVPVPSAAQTTTATIAQSVAADAFSRGSQIPVTPSDPTLFYRSASELLCSNIAAQVVDPTSGTGVYSMSDVPGAIANMVETLMGYPPGHPAHADAVQILQEHYDMARTTSSSSAGGRPGTTSATNALRSTFILACESPTAVGIGL
jgi:hypothetical protein